MTDHIDATDQAMKGLCAYRCDQVANRKRQALTAIAATLDTWAAATSDDADNNFVAAITAATTGRNKMLIEAEFPKTRVILQITGRRAAMGKADRAPGTAQV